MYVCLCLCVTVYPHVCISVYLCVCVSVYPYVCICVAVCVSVCVCICGGYLYFCVVMYLCFHMCVHMCVCTCMCILYVTDKEKGKGAEKARELNRVPCSVRLLTFSMSPVFLGCCLSAKPRKSEELQTQPQNPNWWSRASAKELTSQIVGPHLAKASRFCLMFHLPSNS